MDTVKVRNAFSTLVGNVETLTAQREELVLMLRNVLAVIDHDERYLSAAAAPGESATACSARLVLEAQAVLARDG